MENTTEERMENTTETRMGGMDMSDKKMNAESLRGTVRVLLSAVCFSTGGVLIKSIPWSSVTIQGARSIFSVLVVGCYMLLRRQKFVWNKTVLFGAVCNTVMAFAFVAATKLTTAANAIVLQFTEPVFVILLMWLIFHKKPGRDAVFACAGVFAGILCFFYTSLDAGAMAGNLLAILSGLAYALVMMQKKFRGADFESSLLYPVAERGDRNPVYGQENEMSLHNLVFVLLLACAVWSVLCVPVAGTGCGLSGHGVADLDDRAHLKSDSGGCLLWGDNRCNCCHRRPAGGRFGDGLQCKAGKKRCLNPYKKAGRSHTKGTKKTKIYEQPVKYLLKKEIAEQKVSCYNNF